MPIDLTAQLIEISGPPDDEPHYDFSYPEDVLIYVVESERTGSPSWKRYSIESVWVMGIFGEPSGAASYESCEVGFLDYTLEGILDPPVEEGFFVVEGVTATYTKGEWGFTDDDMDFYYTGIRPATLEEIGMFFGVDFWENT